METETPVRDDPTLSSIRRRSQGYLGYLFWVAVVICSLWGANLLTSLVERWIALLGEMRRAAGFAAPAAGPDFWILGGVALLAVAATAVLIAAYAAYRSVWNRRLAAVWGGVPPAHLARLRAFAPVAGDAELRRRTAYLQALRASAGWAAAEACTALDGSRQAYCDAAAATLRSVETDIAHRAVTAGLVIGLNRNALIDTLTIAAAAFELQLHVLTRLGKRPSPRTWVVLVQRTAASLFLNTYVSRDDALYLNLAIRKAALDSKSPPIPSNMRPTPCPTSIGTTFSAASPCRAFPPSRRLRPWG